MERQSCAGKRKRAERERRMRGMGGVTKEEERRTGKSRRAVKMGKRKGVRHRRRWKGIILSIFI